MPGTALCIGLVYPHDHSGRPRLFCYPHSTDEDTKTTGPAPLSWEMEELGTDPATGSKALPQAPHPCPNLVICNSGPGMTSGASILAEQSGAERGRAGQGVPGSPGLCAHGKGGAACCQVRCWWLLIHVVQRALQEVQRSFLESPQAWPLSLLSMTRPHQPAALGLCSCWHPNSPLTLFSHAHKPFPTTPGGTMFPEQRKWTKGIECVNTRGRGS